MPNLTRPLHLIYATLSDYLVIALYSAVLIAMGVSLAKKASGRLEDYFLCGRKLPCYFLGCSGMAAWFDVTGTMVMFWCYP